jgi:hypothetical protein
LQHRRRSVNGNHLGDKRRDGRRDLTGAASEIADDPVGLRERAQRGEMTAIASALVANGVPLSG